MRRKDDIIREVCETLVNNSAIEGFEYDHFKQSDAVSPPFAVYRRVAQPNFSADGIVYHHGDGVDLELYAETHDKMANLMTQVEELLDAENIFYRLAADTVYIETEDFYESLYEI